MKKFGYIIAAIGAIAIAAPSIASADTVVIKRGDRHHGEFRDHRFGARADIAGIAIAAGIEAGVITTTRW